MSIMAQDLDHDLLQTIITDIAAMTDPLPDPTNEAISSIVLQTQLQYLRNSVAKLETKNHELREDNAALRDENAILRFENDVLLTQENRKHEAQAPSSSPLKLLSSDLINLSPDESSFLETEEVKDNKDHRIKADRADILRKTETQATTLREAKAPQRKENDDPRTPGCKNNPIVIDDVEELPLKQLSLTDGNILSKQQHTPRTTNRKLLDPEADDQNTSLFLKDILPNTNYRALLEAIAIIRPGRIKEAQIKDGNTASIAFFTRNAAEKLYAAFQKKHTRPLDPLLCNVSASWSSKHVPPEDTDGRTRVLGVEGYPHFVNIANVLAAVRSQGFNPQMESIILTPPQMYLKNGSVWSGPLQQVICRFRGVRDAEQVHGILARVFSPEWQVSFEYLPDTCE